VLPVDSLPAAVVGRLGAEVAKLSFGGEEVEVARTFRG